MILNYKKLCFDEHIQIDNKIITPEELDENKDFIVSAMHRMLEHYIADINNIPSIFHTLISMGGTYEKTERCDQCGDYNTIINLEI